MSYLTWHEIKNEPTPWVQLLCIFYELIHEYIPPDHHTTLCRVPPMSPSHALTLKEAEPSGATSIHYNCWLRGGSASGPAGMSAGAGVAAGVTPVAGASTVGTVDAASAVPVGDGAPVATDATRSTGGWGPGGSVHHGWGRFRSR